MNSMEQFYSSRSALDWLIELGRRITRLLIAIRLGKKGLTLWLFYDSPRTMRSYLWTKYSLDSCIRRDNTSDIGKRKENRLVRLCEDGIVKFCDIDHKLIDSFVDRLNIEHSSNYSSSLDFCEPFLHKVLQETGVLALITEYYGGTAYFRERPTLNVLVKGDAALNSKPSRVFHSDGYRQVSIMLLLNDLNEADIHMEYCVGSHLTQQHTYDRRRLRQELIEDSFIKKKVIGPRGSLFVFDTEGFHRGLYQLQEGSPEDYRLILHANFHPGIYDKLAFEQLGK